MKGKRRKKKKKEKKKKRKRRSCEYRDTRRHLESKIQSILLLMDNRLISKWFFKTKKRFLFSTKLYFNRCYLQFYLGLYQKYNEIRDFGLMVYLDNCIMIRLTRTNSIERYLKRTMECEFFYSESKGLHTVPKRRILSHDSFGPSSNSYTMRISRVPAFHGFYEIS